MFNLYHNILQLQLNPWRVQSPAAGSSSGGMIYIPHIEQSDWSSYEYTTTIQHTVIHVISTIYAGMHAPKLLALLLSLVHKA